MTKENLWLHQYLREVFLKNITFLYVFTQHSFISQVVVTNLLENHFPYLLQTTIQICWFNFTKKWCFLAVVHMVTVTNDQRRLFFPSLLLVTPLLNPPISHWIATMTSLTLLLGVFIKNNKQFICYEFQPSTTSNLDRNLNQTCLIYHGTLYYGSSWYVVIAHHLKLYWHHSKFLGWACSSKCFVTYLLKNNFIFIFSLRTLPTWHQLTPTTTYLEWHTFTSNIGLHPINNGTSLDKEDTTTQYLA